MLLLLEFLEIPKYNLSQNTVLRQKKNADHDAIECAKNSRFVPSWWVQGEFYSSKMYTKVISIKSLQQNFQKLPCSLPFRLDLI